MSEPSVGRLLVPVGPPSSTPLVQSNSWSHPGALTLPKTRISQRDPVRALDLAVPENPR